MEIFNKAQNDSANSLTKLQIDREQAIAQLRALGYKADDLVCLRFFLPSVDSRSKEDKGRKLEGRFPNLPWSLIERLQAEGRGCYFVVNRGGHKDENIYQGQALFYEHDDLSKDISRNLGQQLGLPEPTLQVDTGGKSVHSYLKLSKPCSPKEWRELQTDLLEYVDGDRALKNPSRVMRLAGAYHIKAGREPIQSKIILNTGKAYSYEELRAIVPKQRQRQSQQNPLSWGDFSSNFRLPIDDPVPLYECLTRSDRDLIDRGTVEGERNDRGFALAANLIATANDLTEIGQLFEEDPQQLFEHYCQNCTPSIDSAETESIWKSATLRAKSTSLSAEQIENCIKGWKWRQLRSKLPGQTEDGSRKSAQDLRVVNATDRFATQSQSVSIEEIEVQIRDYLRGSPSPTELQKWVFRWAEAVKRPTRDIWALVKAIQAEQDSQQEQAEVKRSLPSLLDYQNRRLDPRKFLDGELPELIIETAKAMPTAPGFIFTTLIAASASRIGTAARVVIKASAKYTQPCIFQTAIVSPSGGKKTPAQRVVIDPLLDIEAAANKEYELATEAVEQELNDYEAAVADYKQAKKQGKEAEFPEKPEIPIRKRFITKDSTIEVLQSIHAANPRGILVYRDELIANKKSQNLYRGGFGADAEIELELYNGCSIVVDRKNNGSIFLHESAISRTGSIQEGVLKKWMGDHSDENGEKARWLFCAEPCPLAYIDLTSPEADKDTGISEVLRKLYEDLEKIPHQDYILSYEARVKFQDWQHQLVDWAREEGQSGLKVAYPKFESYTARLALWLHIVNSVLKGNLHPEPVISGKTMAKAIELTDYYVGQLRLIYARNAPEARVSDNLLKIKELAEQLGRAISARDVQAKVRCLRKTPAAEIRELFKTLVDSGWGSLQGEGQKVQLVPPTADTADEVLAGRQQLQTRASQDLQEDADTADSFPANESSNPRPEKVEPCAAGVSNVITFTESLTGSEAETFNKSISTVSQASAASATDWHPQLGERLRVDLPGSKCDSKLATVQGLKLSQSPPMLIVLVDGEQQPCELLLKWLQPLEATQ